MQLMLLDINGINGEHEYSLPHRANVETSFLSLDKYKEYFFLMIPEKLFVGYYSDGCILHGKHPSKEITTLTPNPVSHRHSSLDYSIQISSAPWAAHAISKSRCNMTYTPFEIRKAQSVTYSQCAVYVDKSFLNLMIPIHVGIKNL